MNTNFSTDSGGSRKSRVSLREDIIYEDDGFFSDVPGSGSLSRSLLALNKYVKKNMLYDESEEYETESAYFTKESSPNESRNKYDSDSDKSNESTEGNKTPTKISTATITYGVTSVTQLTDDYKSMQLHDKSVNKSVTTYDTNSNESKEQNVEIPKRVSKSVPSYNESIYQPEHNSASLTNLANISKSELENNIGDQVVLRNKQSDNKNEDYRHTLHEFSEWGNRTNVYPDVYAPLPYSEYSVFILDKVVCFIFYIVIFFAIH